jgi:hypothetical protein
MWRGGLRFSLSATAPFVWRCLNREVLRELKADPAAQDIPLIMVTMTDDSRAAPETPTS